MKDSIIFYLSHYEVVKQMDNEQLGKLYRALFELALGNEPKIDDDIKIPFGFIKNQMVLDIEKYNEKELDEFSSLQGREVGYVLSKDYWGQGLMSEAIQGVIKYLFEEVKLDFIAGCFFKRNNRSRRVQEKNGFKFYKETIYETRYGTKEESIYMILAKDEYINKNNN